jgi:hypothetical protein
LTNTIIYNFNTDSDTTPVYQRNIYTNKITPKNISVLKGDIADIINRTTIDIGKLFDKNEESTGKTYTNVGASFFVFKDAEEYY